MSGHIASETQDLTRSSEQLAEMADALHKLLDQFKVE